MPKIHLIRLGCGVLSGGATLEEAVQNWNNCQASGEEQLTAATVALYRAPDPYWSQAALPGHVAGELVYESIDTAGDAQTDELKDYLCIE